MQPGIRIHCSHRLEDLTALLARRLEREPLPPLCDETILVPGQGIAHWLRGEIASRHGIAAGLEMPFPAAFLHTLGERLDAEPARRFSAGVLALRIHRLLGSPDARLRFGIAARYCENDPDGRKRMQLAQRLASCFDDYQLYRPDLLDRAANGDELDELGPHARWQARLWRALLDDAGLGEADAALAAHRLRALERRLEDEDAELLLPDRLSVFAASTLAPPFLRLLVRLGRKIPVDLYVPTPSSHYFGDRGHVPSVGNDHALLRHLGVEAREFQDLLIDLEDEPGEPPILIDRPDPPAEEERPPDLLHSLQLDLALARERAADDEDALFVIPPGDASLRVHDCHSELRELEVVRDQILGAFADDPTLEPHEVMVLVPDIARYAPYAEAVFGPVRSFLPFAVADRDPVSSQPICAAMLDLLRLAQSRVRLHDVLQFLEIPAIRRRFEIAPGDLPSLRHLCERAGIRWGIDGRNRARRFGVPVFDDASWRSGMRRLLLGVATGPCDELVHGILPCADVTSGREERLDRLLGFLEKLFLLLPELQRAHPLLRWADLVERAIGDLFAPDADDDSSLQTLRKALAELRRAADAAEHDEEIAPIVFDDWLRGVLHRGAGAGLWPARVTVAAMLPMRAVPVRHLFVCGLSDLRFPRSDPPVPFDLRLDARRPGDRNRRLDDRQLFLDCLLAARERLHLTFVGHSAKDDSECAPSVVLTDLIDYVERNAAPPPGYATARDWLVVRHPLQAWSPRYRRGDDERLFTFAKARGDASAIGNRDEPFWISGPVDAAPMSGGEPLELDSLIDFWTNPSRFFVRNVLGIHLPSDDAETPDTETFRLEALDQWRLLEDLVRRRSGSLLPEEAAARARAAGLLPVGGTGETAFAWVDESGREFLDALEDQGALEPREIVCRVGDLVVRGELPRVGRGAIVHARALRLKPRHRLHAWLLHTTASVARHQGASLPDRTVLLLRNAKLHFTPLDPEEAVRILGALVAGYREGSSAPLPFFERSSYAYAARSRQKKAGPDEALQAARGKWNPNPFTDYPDSDSEDRAIALCTRGRDPLADRGFADLALRIWLPLLASEGEGT